MRTVGIVSGLMAAALATVWFPVEAAATNEHMIRHIKKRALTPTATDIEILNFGLTFQVGVSFDGLKRFSAEDFAKAGLDKRVRQRFQQIAKEEKIHILAFEGILGDDAVSPCQYNFSTSIRMSTAAWFARSAEFIEGIGVAAYQTAIRELSNERFTYAYSAIMAVEARHTSYLSEVQNQSDFPVSFETALTYSQAYTVLAEFIVPGTCASQTKTTMGLNFKEPAGSSQKYYAAFLCAGTTTYEPMKRLSAGSYRVNIPTSLKGVIYIMVTTSSNNLKDSNTVAGPLVSVETD
ncbi:BQ2448_1997 [Microbotryum intermedium]|uniref:BQ2448_1997 protein n=1 Tax=Microbotryum intermedium TaxID=269621 RepID=A0A238F747_9BASI|nr:BQ2448_1997 [Microbotryum intermedium]